VVDSYFLQARPEMLYFVPKSASKVLEVGCGAGVFLSQLKDSLGCETWGVDFLDSTELVRHPDHYLQGSIESVVSKLPDSSFDCIVLNDVLEHMVEPEKVLSLLTSKLKTGGTFVASIPNILHWSALVGLLVRRDWKYEEFGVMDRTHLRFFTRKSILRMFDSAGLRIVKMRGINGWLSLEAIVVVILSLGFLRESMHLQWGLAATKDNGIEKVQ
jgi:2-polyprenyl-3-methyl-5-hydroxy-6-metoxy-1,4-benzoquinol methylase